MHSNKGFTTLEIILMVVLGALLLLGGGWIYYQQTQDEVQALSSFEECVEAGYPVMESHPRQCLSPDGQLFIEELDEAEEEYTEYTTPQGEVIRINHPQEGDVVESPLRVSGQVRGTWSFEADFPIELTDQDRETIVREPASLLGEWMTEEYVPFELTLEFDDSDLSGQGFLILIKDNPTGEPRHDDFLEIPIRFNR